MGFDSVYRRGIQRVWMEDGGSQLGYLGIIQEARQMDGMDFRELKACFIPNDGYFAAYFGEESRDAAYGCYDSGGRCFWNNCLVFPVFNAAGAVVSLAGFNPLRYAEAKEKQDKSINYYIYSPKHLFTKGRYLFYIENMYLKALEDGYLFLTDGIFDTLALSVHGYNAAALMGSYLSQEVLMQLRFIDRVVLAADNDAAGMKLYDNLRIHLNNAELAKQGAAKDMDELLKGSRKASALAWLDSIVRCRNGRRTVWTYRTR